MLYDTERIQRFDRNLHMYMLAARSAADAPKRHLLLRIQSDEILIQFIHQASSSSIFSRKLDPPEANAVTEPIAEAFYPNDIRNTHRATSVSTRMFQVENAKDILRCLRR